ncbi:MAG: hypothetical protein ACI9BD_000091 [Candidatus Marinamargulisbacteria bacterium]|jgi:hypothetical protein
MNKTVSVSMQDLLMPGSSGQYPRLTQFFKDLSAPFDQPLEGDFLLKKTPGFDVEKQLRKVLALSDNENQIAAFQDLFGRAFEHDQLPVLISMLCMQTPNNAQVLKSKEVENYLFEINDLKGLWRYFEPISQSDLLGCAVLEKIKLLTQAADLLTTPRRTGLLDGYRVPISGGKTKASRFSRLGRASKSAAPCLQNPVLGLKDFITDLLEDTRGLRKALLSRPFFGIGDRVNKTINCCPSELFSWQLQNSEQGKAACQAMMSRIGDAYPKYCKGLGRSSAYDFLKDCVRARASLASQRTRPEEARKSLEIFLLKCTERRDLESHKTMSKNLAATGMKKERLGIRNSVLTMYGGGYGLRQRLLGEVCRFLDAPSASPSPLVKALNEVLGHLDASLGLTPQALGRFLSDTNANA